MRARAERRHELVLEQLAKRQDADTQRAHEIFAAFRTNLRDSLAALKRRRGRSRRPAVRRRPAAPVAPRHRGDEPPPRRARRRGGREVAAITDRYADVKPHTTAAAVVFALTPRRRRRVG